MKYVLCFALFIVAVSAGYVAGPQVLPVAVIPSRVVPVVIGHGAHGVHGGRVLRSAPLVHSAVVHPAVLPIAAGHAVLGGAGLVGGAGLGLAHGAGLGLAHGAGLGLAHGSGIGHGQLHG